MTIMSFEYLVRGNVHGVGFRYYLREIAKAEGIVGWVKNDPAGHVIGLAQGQEPTISKFKKALETGPLHANVTGVEIKGECTVERPQFDAFSIVH